MKSRCYRKMSKLCQIVVSLVCILVLNNFTCQALLVKGERHRDKGSQESTDGNSRARNPTNVSSASSLSPESVPDISTMSHLWDTLSSTVKDPTEKCSHDSLCKVAEIMGKSEWCIICDPRNLHSVKNLAVHRRCEMERLMYQNYREGRFRPHFGGDAEIIHVDLNIHNIGPVMDTEMIVRYDLYLNLVWTDLRFTFSEYIKHITFQQETIERDELLWIPTLYFPDGLHAIVPDVMKPNIQVKAYNNGTIRYSARTQLDNACIMSLGHFPLDVQHCELCIESYTHTTEEVQFKWRDHSPVVFGERLLQYSNYPMTAHFTVSNPSQYEINDKFESGSYSKLCVNIIFERKLLHYILADYLPSAMIVCLSWVSFFVSPDLIPARASLSITTVLAIITLIGGTQQRFPSVSDLKALDIYYFTCFLYVFLCLLEFACASYRAKKLPPVKKAINVTLADIGALALKLHAVNSIDEEDDLGGVDLYPPESAFYRQPSAPSFGSSMSSNNAAGGAGLKNSMSRETGLGMSSNQSRLTQSNGAAMNKNAQDDKDCPFMSYETTKRLSLKHAKELDKMARIFFPLTFILFNIIYWVTYCWLRKSAIPNPNKT